MPSFINNQTNLDLNGPILTFTTQPSSTSVCGSGSVTFTGIATATFPTQSPPNLATGTGYISYNWYLDGYGQLSDGDLNGITVAGSTTTSLTLSNIPSNSTLNNSKFFLRADYIASAYSVPGSDVTLDTIRTTGNAVNDPKDSDFATLTVYPNISVTKNPSDVIVARESAAVFSVEATTTDNSQSNISYQWQINEVDLNDGTITDLSFLTNPDTLITLTDSDGITTTIDFDSISSYSNFVPGKTYTLVSNKNITTKITAAGGGGGTETGRGTPGGKGGLSSGTFTFVAYQEYKLIVGGGAKGSTPGFGGGGSGSVGGAGGVTGAGGGYTGLFLSSVAQSNSILIAGGGGGGANDPAVGGDGGGLEGSAASNAFTRGGGGGTQSQAGTGGAGGGSALQGGSGAGGGGGGYFGGAAGNLYAGCCADGAGGGGSGYLHPVLITGGTSVTGGGSSAETNGTFKIEYISSSFPTTASLEVSGSKTPTLNISSTIISGFSVRCKVTHPTACNSPVYSNTASFNVISPLNRAVIEVEAYQPNSSTATLKEFDITSLDYTITSDVINSDTICLYAKERDLNVELELFAAKGEDSDYTSPTKEPGGEGGYSKIRFIMKKNEEYIIKGILTKTSIYLYRKSQLIACVGQGGKGGRYGAGGRGGGVGVSGENGFGRSSGSGGVLIGSGQLTGNGIFGSSSTATSIYSEDLKQTGTLGGRTISCTKGVYWRGLGKTACEDLGTIKFRLTDGTEVLNSALISRGFKDGYNINQTAGGNDGSEGGKGGNGATGGNGGTSGGGGGGSGYTDTSITVVDTRLGGNNKQETKVVIRLFSS